MVNSRLRDSSNLFDCYFEVELDQLTNPCVIFKYPNNYNDETVIKSVPNFCFPYNNIEFETICHFSFVLTGEDSKWSYGFVRHLPGKSNCALVLMSSYCWSQTFFKLLNYISDIKTKYDKNHFNIFLESLFKAENKSSAIAISYIYYVDNKLFSYKIQMNDKITNKRLPCIPDDRNLTEFFSALEPMNMIHLFASILNERRIIIHSTRLTRLSACVQASNLLIFPFQWENVFIPILPIKLLDYLSCPTPFIIGIHSSTLEKINLAEFGDGVDLVILDLDKNIFESPHNDTHDLPQDVVNHLKKGLKKTQQMFGDGLSRLFLRAIIIIIGGYRQALRLTPGEKITFNDNAFIQSGPQSMQPFLEKMLHLQLFRQFIENRLDRLNSGLGFDDCFDLELNNYSVDDYKSTKFKVQYQEWLLSFKKGSGNLVKSINPSMRSAYKNIKDKSKKTYKDICGKINENLNKKSNSLSRNHLFNSNLDLNPNNYRKLPGMSNNYEAYGKFFNECQRK